MTLFTFLMKVAQIHNEVHYLMTSILNIFVEVATLII